MNKLMIVAVAAAMTVMQAAAIDVAPINCNVETPETPAQCDYMVFKVTGSGKTVQAKKTYKTVTSLKVKKGALLMKPSTTCCNTQDGAEVCCYDTANLYATVKVGKETYKIALSDLNVIKWSVFGKDFEKAYNWKTQLKQGKKATLESDLFLSTAAGVVDKDTFDPAWVDGLEEEIALAASAFGKFQVKVNKANTKVSGTSYCQVTTNSTACAAVWTPKSYSGWFVGLRNGLEGDQACFNCDCIDAEIFGGTWKASYQAKKLTNVSAQQLGFGETYFDESAVTFDDWEVVEVEE